MYIASGEAEPESPKSLAVQPGRRAFVYSAIDIHILRRIPSELFYSSSIEPSGVRCIELINVPVYPIPKMLTRPFWLAYLLNIKIACYVFELKNQCPLYKRQGPK